MTSWTVRARYVERGGGGDGRGRWRGRRSDARIAHGGQRRRVRERRAAILWMLRARTEDVGWGRVGLRVVDVDVESEWERL